MSADHSVAAVARMIVIPTAPWLPWLLLAGAALFVVGLPLLLFVIARRSRWDRR